MFQVQMIAEYNEGRRRGRTVIYSRHLVTRLHAERLAELWRMAGRKPPMEDTTEIYVDQYAEVPERLVNLELRVFDAENDDPDEFPRHNYHDRCYGPIYNQEARELMVRYELDSVYGRWVLGAFNKETT